MKIKDFLKIYSFSFVFKLNLICFNFCLLPLFLSVDSLLICRQFEVHISVQQHLLCLNSLEPGKYILGCFASSCVSFLTLNMFTLEVGKEREEKMSAVKRYFGLLHS